MRGLPVNLRGILPDFQSFTEKPVFECAFAYPIMLFLSYLFKNSMDRVSVMKWYLTRMCMCPFNSAVTILNL